MKTITINDPSSSIKTWEARYTVEGAVDARLIRIQSRSAIEVSVAKITEEILTGHIANYYIASPNFGVAIPGITTLEDTFWITEKLQHNGMSTPDAITVAQVLRDMGDF